MLRAEAASSSQPPAPALASTAAPTTPPRHRHRRASNTNNQAPRTPSRNQSNGLWSNGRWWCNCDPRKEAVPREVKKNSPNKGKWFWTCNGRYPYCDFFLWFDEAKAYETGPPQGSQEGEQQQPPRPKTPVLRQRALTEFGVAFQPTRRPSEPEAAPEAAPEAEALDSEPVGADQSRSRPRDLTLDNAVESDREADLYSDSDNMTRITRRAMTQANPVSQAPQTSPKRKQPEMECYVDLDGLGSDEERELTGLNEPPNHDPFVTPVNQRSVDVTNGLPTPSLTRVLFPEASNKRHKTVSFEEPSMSSTLTPGSSSTTPSANCGRSVLSSPAHLPPSSSPSDASCDVTDEVMGLLRDQNVDPAVLRSVRELLTTSALKAKGISRGRDVAREALREKDEKMFQQSERIRALENKYGSLEGQLTRMKANLMKIYDDN